jgi:hypothetical protein
MSIRFIGWTAVLVCVFSVMMAVIGSNQATPQSASGYSVPMWQNSQAQACQKVMNRLDSLQRNALAANESGRMTPMAAVDNCVARQAQIDISKCPSDFRMAVARYIAAENTLTMDARMNSGNQAGQTMDTLMRVYGRQPMNSFGNAPEEMRGDLANFQSAARQLNQMAAKYCKQ